MRFIKLVSGEPVPYSIIQFRRDANVSVRGDPDAAILADYDVYHVAYSDEPTLEPGEQATRKTTPELIGNNWVLGWDVTTIPIAEMKDSKLAELATRRWQAEEGGTTLGGNPLATDRTTQTKLTAAYIKASADSEYTIPAWKSGPGVFSALNAATIIAAADAIEAHVQACFANEAALSGEIEAATTIAELSAVDIEASWP